VNNKAFWDKISQLEMLIVNIKEWIYSVDWFFFSENRRFLLQNGLFREIFHRLAFLACCNMRHFKDFMIILSLLLFRLIAIFIFNLSSDWRQKIISSFKECGMTKDEFIRLLARFVKSIHVELYNKLLTCLMKLLTLRCLKYLGNTSPSKA
jgi:hypothetical protein